MTPKITLDTTGYEAFLVDLAKVATSQSRIAEVIRDDTIAEGVATTVVIDRDSDRPNLIVRIHASSKMRRSLSRAAYLAGDNAMAAKWDPWISEPAITGHHF